MRRLLDELRNTDGPVIVAMHHHLGIPKGYHKWLDDRWMATLDSRALLTILRHYTDHYTAKNSNNSVLIIHGHKHRLYNATDKTNKIFVFGISSSTLGTEYKHIDPASDEYVLDGNGVIAHIGMTEKGQWAISVASSM